MADFAVKEYRVMTNIFKEGSHGDTAYILKEGTVIIYTLVKGERYVLAELTAPTIFGEMALLTKDQIRTASAEANSTVQVIEIDKAKFDELINQSPSVIALIMKALARRLVETTSRVKKSV